MDELDPHFARLLRHHDIDELNAQSASVYGVWADFRLAYLNPAWFRFSRENGGEPGISTYWRLGRSILESLRGDVRLFYEARFRRCLDECEIWGHEYECSSDKLYRRFREIVYPLGKSEGLLIANSLVVERPHAADQRLARAADAAAYVDGNGFICQCAHCRRVKNFREGERWDWVPEWVRRVPESASHTFCPTCFGYYYKKPDYQP